MLLWVEQHSALAAWVQAIGAIVALAISVFLPIQQRRSLERVASRAARSALNPTMEALTRATDYRRRIDRNPSQRDAETERRLYDDLSRAEEKLNAFPIEMLAENVGSSFQEVRNHFWFLRIAFDPDRGPFPIFLHRRMALLRSLRSACARAPQMELPGGIQALDQAINGANEEIQQLLDRMERAP